MSETKFSKEQEEAKKRAEAKIRLIKQTKPQKGDKEMSENPDTIENPDTNEINENIVITEDGKKFDKETGEIIEEIEKQEPVNENEAEIETEKSEQEATEQEPEAIQKVAVKTTDDILMEAFKEFIDELQKPKIDDRAVRTTIHIDKDVSEKLDKICYKKQGLKTKIINSAIRSIVESGKAEKMAKTFDDMKKLKEKRDRRFYDSVIDKFDKLEGEQLEKIAEIMNGKAGS